jgi:glyoxylase-like metal-dependent hydrolase (beta-lactamase superfamily II)
VSARWAVPLGAVVNRDHPAAAGLSQQLVPIELVVHTLVHPEFGLYVIDSGITRDRAAGGHGPVIGHVARAALASIEPVSPLLDILELEGQALRGVFLTHTHIDHVLGLVDLPFDVPVTVGPGEGERNAIEDAALAPTIEAALAGRTVLEWPFDGAPPLGQVDAAVDVFGDGSLLALSVPGHSHGSTAFLVRSSSGPVLLTGDCSHTLWGWANGVEPGYLSADGDDNARSLRALRALADATPGIRVLVGHETDGASTGIR